MDTNFYGEYSTLSELDEIFFCRPRLIFKIAIIAEIFRLYAQKGFIRRNQLWRDSREVRQIP